MLQMRGLFQRNRQAGQLLRSAGRGPAPLSRSAGRAVCEALEERRLLASTIQFDSPTAVTTTSVAWGVETADFNNDDILDLAATSADGFVEVLLGDGAGGFAGAGQFAVGALPRDLAIGDFDNDGNQDVAALNTGDDTVSVLLGNGDGTLGAQTSFALIAESTVIATADLDQDGNLDLVTNTGATGLILTLSGNGDGTFGNAVPINVGVDVTGLALADLDGQDGPDLVFTTVNDDTVRVHLNQGDGTFGDADSYTLGADPQDVVAGDVDLDGDLDLAVASSGGLGASSLSVLLNDGAGAFVELPDQNLTTSGVSLLAADFNQDRLPDLAALLVNGQTDVLAGDGGGGFALETTLAPIDGTPTQFVSGDFDGDGDTDLLSADFAAHGLTYHANSTPAPPAAPGIPDLDAVSDLGVSDSDDITSLNSDLQFTVTGAPDGSTVRLYLGSNVIGQGTAANGAATIVTDVGTLDDGVYQVTAAYEDGGELSARSDAFAFTIETTPPVFTSTPQIFVPIGPQYRYDAQTDEENQDGFRYALTTAPDGMTIDSETGVVTWTPTIEDFGEHDVVISGTDLAGNTATQEFTLTADTLLTFGAVRTQSLGGATWDIASGDFNDDGQDDVAVSFVLGSVMIYLSDGDGTFTAGEFYNVGVSPRTLHVADFNSDNRLDIASANFGSDDVSVIYGLGDGTFTQPLTFDVAAGPIALASADLDGQNGVDLIAVSTATNQVSVLLNDTGPGFADAVNYSTDAAPSGAAAGDYDQDGDIDLAISSAGLNRVQLLTNDGTGTLNAGDSYGVGSSPNDVAFVDMDNDGWLDLVTANSASNGGLSILLNDRTGGFAGANTTDVGRALDLLHTADLNGDGPVDLLAGDSGSIATILRNSTLGGVESPFNLNIIDQPIGLSAGDVDGDGVRDVIALLDTNEFMVLINETTPPPAAPAAPDLAPAFDTGASDSDNVTRFNNAVGEPMEFVINDVLNGATVSLYAGGVLLGESVASGDSVVITTDADSVDTVLGEGAHELRVFQTLYATSVASLPTIITVDSVDPTITTRPGLYATVDQDYSYDVDADEEGDDGVVYSVVTGPAGFNVDPDTGVVSWTPSQADRGTHDVTVRITDLAGNTTDQSYTLGVLEVDSDNIPDLGPDAVIEAIPRNFELFDPDSDRVDIDYSGSGELLLGRLAGHVEYIIAIGDVNNLTIKVKQGPGGNGELHVGSLIGDSIGKLTAREVYITGGTIAEFDGQMLLGTLNNAKMGGFGEAAGLNIGAAPDGGLKLDVEAVDTTGSLIVNGVVDKFKIRGDFEADSVAFTAGVERLQAEGDWNTASGATFGQALPGLDGHLPTARKMQFKQDVDGSIAVQQEVRKFDVRGETLDDFDLDIAGETRNFRIREEMKGQADLADARKIRLDDVAGDLTAGDTRNARFEEVSGTIALGAARKIQFREDLTGAVTAESANRFIAKANVTGATIDFTLVPGTVDDLAVKKFDVKGRTSDTTITADASMKKMIFRDGLFDSNVLLGISGAYDPATGLPEDGTDDILVGIPTRIDNFDVQTSTDVAFQGSIVMAHIFDDIDLGRVFLNNGDLPFGIGTQRIDSLTLTYASGGGTFRGDAAFLVDNDTTIDFKVNQLPVDWT